MTNSELGHGSTGIDRVSRLGAAAWVLLIQYFVFLFVVQSQWTTPYSWIRNAISDLGAATCSHSDQVDSWICSPWHRVANVSWVIAGACLTIGALTCKRLLPRNRLTHTGTSLYALSGLGLVLVGLNPEDTGRQLHVFGAAVAIAGGIAALLCVTTALLKSHQWPAVASTGLALGLAALTGFTLMLTQVGGHNLFGLWERIAAFPILIWPILCGTHILRATRRESSTKSPV